MSIVPEVDDGYTCKYQSYKIFKFRFSRTIYLKVINRHITEMKITPSNIMHVLFITKKNEQKKSKAEKAVVVSST